MRLHRYDDVHVSKDRTGNTWAMSNGYLRTALNAPALLRDNDGGTAVHRMVLLEAIGEGTHECHWCGTSVTWKHFDKQSWDGVLVADHLDGNRANNEASNLVPACFSCNILRGRWGNEWVLNRGRRD